MWSYEKRLQFPVNIKEPNAKIAQVIMSQYGGPDGELGASMRYISQRYSMPYNEVAAILTDIGTEELAHLEMVSTIVHQLTRNLSMEEIEESGFANYYVDHTVGIWPMAAGGIPFNTCEFQSKGDAITDLFEDMAADVLVYKHNKLYFPMNDYRRWIFSSRTCLSFPNLYIINQMFHNRTTKFCYIPIFCKDVLFGAALFKRFLYFCYEIITICNFLLIFLNIFLKSCSQFQIILL